MVSILVVLDMFNTIDNLLSIINLILLSIRADYNQVGKLDI